MLGGEGGEEGRGGRGGGKGKGGGKPHLCLLPVQNTCPHLNVGRESSWGHRYAFCPLFSSHHSINLLNSYISAFEVLLFLHCHWNDMSWDDSIGLGTVLELC